MAKQHENFDDHNGLPPEERRTASRFGRLPDEDYAAIWIGGSESQLAEVHDESLHGISLILDADCGIGIGCEAHIVYAGTCHLARVRHVQPLGREKVLIGFQCEPLPDAASRFGVR